MSRNQPPKRVMTMTLATIRMTALALALIVTVTPSAAAQLLIGPHAGFQLNSATSRSFTESFEWQFGAQVQVPVFSLFAVRAGFDWHPKAWVRRDTRSGDIYGSRRYVDVDAILSVGGR